MVLTAVTPVLSAALVHLGPRSDSDESDSDDAESDDVCDIEAAAAGAQGWVV
jgi:hypothetical protein